MQPCIFDGLLTSDEVYSEWKKNPSFDSTYDAIESSAIDIETILTIVSEMRIEMPSLGEQELFLLAESALMRIVEFDIPLEQIFFAFAHISTVDSEAFWEVEDSFRNFLVHSDSFRQLSLTERIQTCKWCASPAIMSSIVYHTDWSELSLSEVSAAFVGLSNWELLIWKHDAYRKEGQKPELIATNIFLWSLIRSEEFTISEILDIGKIINNPKSWIRIVQTGCLSAIQLAEVGRYSQDPEVLEYLMNPLEPSPP